MRVINVFKQFNFPVFMYVNNLKVINIISPALHNIDINKIYIQLHVY